MVWHIHTFKDNENSKTEESGIKQSFQRELHIYFKSGMCLRGRFNMDGLAKLLLICLEEKDNNAQTSLPSYF